MNLKELKKKFDEKVADRVSICIKNIDERMINNYREIESTRQFIIKEDTMNSGYNLSDNNREDILNSLQKYYAENWEIEFIKNKTISFTLKTEPLKEPAIMNIVREKQENRFEKMDL